MQPNDQEMSSAHFTYRFWASTANLFFIINYIRYVASYTPTAEEGHV